MKINPLILIGIIALVILLYQDEKSWLDNAQEKNNNRFEYANKNIIEASRDRRAKEQRDKEKAERKERYRKFHEGREPTYEEWKAAREKNKEDK